jgi:hypothetical protein
VHLSLSLLFSSYPPSFLANTDCSFGSFTNIIRGKESWVWTSIFFGRSCPSKGLHKWRQKLQQKNLEGRKSLKDKGVVCLGSGILVFCGHQQRKYYLEEICGHFTYSVLCVNTAQAQVKKHLYSASTLLCKRRENTQERKCRYFSNLITSINISSWLNLIKSQNKEHKERKCRYFSNLTTSIYIYLHGWIWSRRVQNTKPRMNTVTTFSDPYLFFRKTQIKTITMKTEMKSSSPIFECWSFPRFDKISPHESVWNFWCCNNNKH